MFFLIPTGLLIDILSLNKESDYQIFLNKMKKTKFKPLILIGCWSTNHDMSTVSINYSVRFEQLNNQNIWKSQKIMTSNMTTTVSKQYLVRQLAIIGL